MFPADTVMQRLQYLVGKPDLLEDPRSKGQPLVIITGIGRNSFTGVTAESMKAEVHNQLLQMELPCEPGSNRGRLHISFEALYQYVQQDKRSSTLSAFLHEASIRYLMVFSGVSGLLAATYVIPKVLANS